MKVPFVIYADTASLLEKNTDYNDTEKPSTTKVKNNIAYGYLLFTQHQLNINRNKYDYYRPTKFLKNCSLRI